MTFQPVDSAGLLPSICVEIDVTNLPTSASRTWTDITTDIRVLSYKQGGRIDELQRNGIGTLTATVKNPASKYDPTYASGLGIKRGQWLRVRAQWAGVTYARWQGIVERVTLTWPEAGLDGVAVIQAADAMKVANLYDLAGNTFSSQTSSARVSSICALAGLTASIADTGVSTLVAISSALASGSMAGSQLQNVEQTENGQVFADASANIVFQSRNYRAQNLQTPVDTIGDNAGEIPYIGDGFEVGLDDVYIFNAVTVTPTNADGSTGTAQSASDTTSQGRYFTRPYSRQIQVSSTTEALACAQYLANRYGDPDPRIASVETSTARATSKWPTILAAVNGTRFTVKRRATNTFTEDGHVEQIGETIVPGRSWRTVFQISPAADQAMWVLGDAVNGLLGQTTVLGY